MTDVNTHTIDLTWVQFSDDPGEVCDTLRDDCSNEAIWYGHYRFPHCPSSNKFAYCQAHKESVAADLSNLKDFRCRCTPQDHHGHFIKWERIKP